MRCSLWKINELDSGMFTDRILVIGDNAHNCPSELNRFAVKRHKKDAGWFALVPDFSDRVADYFPQWLIDRILLGNVSLVLAVNGEKPEMDVAVAVSVVHFLARRCIGQLDTYERSAVFPWAPVPFGVTHTNLVVGSARHCVSVASKTVLWHSGHAKQTWESHFEEADEAWCRHVVRTCARLHSVLRLKSTGETGAGGSLFEAEQACLFLAFYPFLKLTPWAAPEARRKLSKILRNQMRLPTFRECTFAPWDDLERRVNEYTPGFEADLEDRIACWISADGFGAALVDRIAGHAENIFPRLFDGRKPEDILGASLETEDCNGSIGANADELRITCPPEACPPTLDPASLQCSSGRGINHRDKRRDTSFEWPPKSSFAEQLLSVFWTDRCLDNSLTSRQQVRQMALWHLEDKIRRGRSQQARWTMLRGCHWLRNVIGPEPVRQQYVPGQTLADSLLSPCVHATDAEGKGMAGFSLHVPALQDRSDAEIVIHVIPRLNSWENMAALVPGLAVAELREAYTPPASAEALSTAELRKRWRKVKIIIETKRDGTFLKLSIDRGDGQSVKVEPGMPDKSDCKLVSNKSELTAPGRLLLNVQTDPKNEKKQVLTLSSDSLLQEAERQNVNRLRNALKELTGINCISDRSKESTPIQRVLRTTGPNGERYRPIDFTVEKRTVPEVASEEAKGATP